MAVRHSTHGTCHQATNPLGQHLAPPTYISTGNQYNIPMANPSTAAHLFHLWISHSIARSFSSVLSLRIGHTNPHKPLFSQTKPRLTVHNQPLYSIITPKHRRQLRTLHSPCIAVRKTRAWTNTYTAHRHVFLFSLFLV